MTVRWGGLIAEALAVDGIEWMQVQSTNIIIRGGGGNESGTSWNPLGDIVQDNIWCSVMDNKLPPTVGPFQTVKYPFALEQVHTEEADLGAIIFCQPRAILAPLLEGTLIFCSVCWLFMRSRLLLVLAINRVEDIDAPKAFRALDDKRTNVGTLDHNFGNFAMGRDRELPVLLGQCKEMCGSVIFDVVYVPRVKCHVVIEQRVF